MTFNFAFQNLKSPFLVRWDFAYFTGATTILINTHQIKNYVFINDI